MELLQVLEVQEVLEVLAVLEVLEVLHCHRHLRKKVAGLLIQRKPWQTSTESSGTCQTAKLQKEWTERCRTEQKEAGQNPHGQVSQGGQTPVSKLSSCQHVESHC